MRELDLVAVDAVVRPEQPAPEPVLDLACTSVSAVCVVWVRNAWTKRSRTWCRETLLAKNAEYDEG